MNLVNQVLEASKTRAKKNITDWRTALKQAEKRPDPRRKLLYDIYDEIDLDLHTSGIVSVRKNKTLSSKWSIYNSSNEPDDDLTYLLKKTWFTNFLHMALDSIYWGHSLIQINKVEPIKDGKGGIKEIELVPRAHVVPEDGLLLKRTSDQTGIKYREELQYQKWIIETPNKKDLGIYNKLAPYILYKRYAMAAWSAYGELFGMPMRVGKTNTTDSNAMLKMEQAMVNMAGAAFMIIDQNEEIDFIQAIRGDGAVFNELINRCNSEIQTAIMGAVIGSDSQGGSRSKEEVGERTLGDFVTADKEFLENFINEDLLPILIEHGYPFEGCYFIWDEVTDLTSLWNQTNQALAHFDVDEEWVRNTFGIQVTGKRDNSSKAPDNADGQ